MTLILDVPGDIIENGVGIMHCKGIAADLGTESELLRGSVLGYTTITLTT